MNEDDASILSSQGKEHKAQMNHSVDQDSRKNGNKTMNGGERHTSSPKTAFQSSIVLEDGEEEKERTKQRKSTQRETYASHAVQEREPCTPPRTTINLSQPNVDPKQAFTSSYQDSHKGDPLPDDDWLLSPSPQPSTFKSSFSLVDAENNSTPRKSTQQDNYPIHPIQELRVSTPPKPQISLAQPNVDPKDTFQSSYQNLHTGEPLSYDNEPVPVQSAFKSSIALEDAEKNRKPHKSTQQENYATYPPQELEHYSPPRAQINLTQPNVDPKESFQSSYKKSHTGEPLADDGEAFVPRTAFASSIVIEDADKNRTPRKSTQQENYQSYPEHELEYYEPPRAQINLTQPNVNPKDSFQSSYRSSLKGEQLPEDSEIFVPRTAFASSVVIEDADKNRTPRKSTQQENFKSHPAQEIERYSSPKPQISLTQPNVDPKDAFQSSYKSSLKGEQLPEDSETFVPRTAFASSVVIEDADKNRTPRKSTQQENFKSHPVQEMERHSSPKPQISLAQPNVNTKDTFQSSYKSSLKGEQLPEDDETVPVQSAFASSIVIEDADRNRTTRKSTQQENYKSHPAQEVERYSSPKPQISFSQPNVDPKEAFQSSYKSSLKGEQLPEDDEVVPVRSAFSSSIALEDAERNRTTQKSTQKENYAAYPDHELEHYTPPKSYISLSQPNVDPKDSFQSSYKMSHTGEPAIADDEQAPLKTAFTSSIALEDAERSRVTKKSTQQENYAAYPDHEVEHYTPPKAQINLSQPNVDPKDSFQSSYKSSLKGEQLPEDSEIYVPRTAFASSVVIEDADKNRTPRKSTQQENFKSHPAQEIERFSSPKPQISLTQPNVDPKDAFQSSYKTSLKGEQLPEDSEQFVPRTAFASSVVIEDADKNRTPRKSTQQENYKSHPTQDIERYSSPKPQISLSQPNVDPKDAFQSSYKSSLKGEQLPEDSEIFVPRTAFASSVVIEDADKNRTPRKSTQQENFKSHPAQEVERYSSPKPQISLSQPNVDPKDAFQSSYKSSLKGEQLPEDDDTVPVQSAFASSIVIEDADRNKTPRKSTQQENYKSHPAQEVERYSSPKPQISLSQPNVDPKEAFQSSYKSSLKGEQLPEDDEAIPVQSAFNSSITLEDAERTTTPKKSTQRENYPAHPTQEVEYYAPPKAQVNLSQPNVDPKEMFNSSYRNTHKGVPLPAEDEAVLSPSAFKSSITLEDADKNRTPRKSTQRDMYPSHPVQDVEYYAPPKSQVSLTQPNVDSNDTFRSSYRNTHTGELPPANDVALPPPTAFKSSLVLEDADKNRTPRKSTQRENYPSHPVQETEFYSSPKSQISLAQPNINQKELMQSSYRQSHRPESPSLSSSVLAAGRASPAPSRSTFQSSLSLDEGKPSEPMLSTSQKMYATPSPQEYEGQTGRRSSQDAGRTMRSSITLGSDNGPRTSTSSSTYARPSQEALLNASPSKPHSSRQNLDSSFSLGERDQRVSTPTPTSRDSYAQRPSSSHGVAAGRPRPQNEAVSLGTEKTSYASSASSAYARPQTAPQPASPSLKSGDHLRSNIQFSSGEPTFSPRFRGTSSPSSNLRSSDSSISPSYASSESIPRYAQATAASSSRLYASPTSSSQNTYTNSSPQTTYANRPYDSSPQTTYSNSTNNNESPSQSNNVKSPNLTPTRPESPFYGNRTRSSITFGNDQPSYQTTNTAYLNSPPPSASPSPLSPSLSPLSPASATARAARHSQLRSSFSLG